MSDGSENNSRAIKILFSLAGVGLFFLLQSHAPAWLDGAIKMGKLCLVVILGIVVAGCVGLMLYFIGTRTITIFTAMVKEFGIYKVLGFMMASALALYGIIQLFIVFFAWYDHYAVALKAGAISFAIVSTPFIIIIVLIYILFGGGGGNGNNSDPGAGIY